MIVIPIVGPTFEKVKDQIDRAQKLADIIELRVDLFRGISFDQMEQLRASIFLPLLCSDKRLNPTWVDGEDFLTYHNFNETPEDLEVVLENLQKKPAKYYKIATLAKSGSDAVRLVRFSQKHPDVISIAMGEKGKITRIVGGPLFFASLSDEEASAPGQIRAKDTKKKFKLGLIGGSLDSSISAIRHNAVYEDQGLDAFYFKQELLEEDLFHFLQSVKGVLRGLSVTMPHKKAIMPHLDQLDESAKKSGAVNTIVFEKGQSTGYNTDGIGALCAILDHMETVFQKQVYVLGGGGAAVAIVAALREAGALVTSFDREGIKKNLEEHLKSRPDLLINATSCDTLLVPKDWLNKKTVVFDVIQKSTQLLLDAKQIGCEIVTGKEMFIYQALKQLTLWFGNQVDLERAKKVLHAHT